MKWIVLLMTLSAWAQEIEVYRFGNTVVAFRTIENMLVNGSCELPSCVALKKGKQLRNAKLENEWLEGGINPFAARCKHVMGGTVHIGLDSKGNENAFCYFKADDSYLR